MLYVYSMIYTDLLWNGLLLWVVLSLADSLISNCKVFLESTISDSLLRSTETVLEHFRYSYVIIFFLNTSHYSSSSMKHYMAKYWF